MTQTASSMAIRRRALWEELRRAQINPPRRGKIIWLGIRKLPARQEGMRMRLPDAPCRKCGDRHIGCHNGCSRYAAYRLQIRPGRVAELEDAAQKGQFFDRLERIKRDTEHKRRHKTR